MRSRYLTKLFILLLVVLAAASLFFWPAGENEKIEISTPILKDEIEKTVVDDVGASVMTFPRFMGEDNKNRKWEIKAEEASQVLENGSINVILKVVEMMAEVDDYNLTFSSQLGTFNQKENNIKLSGGVVVEGMGYKLEAGEITGSLDNNEIIGTSNVEFSSKRGKVSADKFEITNEGDKIKLTGGVKGIFYPKQEKENND